MRVSSFFAGIGGFDLGLEKAGMQVVFQCEQDRFCQRVLKKHWPDVPCYPDIATLTAEQIPDSDLWSAGFPCQDVSLANQGKRRGLEGKRSGLFYKLAEFIERRNPRWLLLENVPGLLNSHKGEDFRVILRTLDELGYGVAWRVFDAKYFGTPQRRRRVFIVASYQSLRSVAVLFDEQTASFSSGESESQEQRAASRSENCDREANLYSIQHASIGRIHTAGPQAKGYRNDGETYTLDSRGGADAACQTLYPFRIRETPGISRGMDGSRYRSLGNAVAVPIIHWIGSKILQVEATDLSDEKIKDNVLSVPHQYQLALDL
jgi:DNA (cytosine-5)-methyltransferase 1